MALTPYPGDDIHTLLYKFSKNLEDQIGGDLNVSPDDHFQTLLYKATKYLEQASA